MQLFVEIDREPDPFPLEADHPDFPAVCRDEFIVMAIAVKVTRLDASPPVVSEETCGGIVVKSDEDKYLDEMTETLLGEALHQFIRG